MKNIDEQKQKSVRQYLDKHYPPLDEFSWVSNILAELSLEGKLHIYDMENLSAGLMDHKPKEDINAPFFRLCKEINTEPGAFDKIMEQCGTPAEMESQPHEHSMTELQKKQCIISEEIDSLDLSDEVHVAELRDIWLFMYGKGKDSKRILADFDEENEDD